MSNETLIQKLISLNCLEPNTITSAYDPHFYQLLFDGTIFLKQLETIFQKLKINSKKLDSYRRSILNSTQSQSRFEFLSSCLAQLGIKFQNYKDLDYTQYYQNSPFSEELFKIMTQLEQNYIDKLFYEESTNLSQFQTNQNQIDTLLDSITEDKTELELQQDISNFEEFMSGEDLANNGNGDIISRYLLKQISECLSLTEKESGMFFIKDGEYLAKLLVRGHKDASKQENILKIYGKIKIDFDGLFKLSLDNDNESQVLITIQSRLAYGFVSKHERICIKCIHFYVHVFNVINNFYNIKTDDKKSMVVSDSHEIYETDPDKTIAENFNRDLPSFFNRFSKQNFSFIDDESPNKTKQDYNQKRFKDWYLQGNFQELFYQGMERNVCLELECVSIIMLAGKENGNDMLIRQARLNHLPTTLRNFDLLERIYYFIINTSVSLFEMLRKSFQVMIALLVENIIKDCNREVNFKHLFSFLAEKAVKFNYININQSQASIVIKTFIVQIERPYHQKVLPTIQQFIRFVSRAFSEEDKIEKCKGLLEGRCSIMEEAIRNAERIFETLWESYLMTGNRTSRNLILENILPGMCHIKTAEHVIITYKRLQKYRKASMVSQINLIDSDFFNKWAMNAEILDTNTFYCLYEIHNTFIEESNKFWLLRSRNSLLMLIREKEINSNIRVFEFFRSKMKIYLKELDSFQQETFSNHRQKDLKLLGPEDVRFQRIQVQISLITALLRRVNFIECLQYFMGLISQLINCKNETIKIFIDKILLDLDEKYDLNMFSNKPKNFRMMEKINLSASTNLYNGNKSPNKSSNGGPYSDPQNKIENIFELNNTMLGGASGDLKELNYTLKRDILEKMTANNTMANPLGPLDNSFFLEMSKKNGMFLSNRKISSGRANSKGKSPKYPHGRPTLKSLAMTKALGDLINRVKPEDSKNTSALGQTSTENEFKIHPNDRKIDVKNFDYLRFFGNEYSKKAAESHSHSFTFKPEILNDTPLSIRNMIKFDGHKQFVKAKPKSLNLQITKVTAFPKTHQEKSLDHKGLKYFFLKYQKLFKDIFRLYSGKNKKKDFNSNDFMYVYKGLIHHSEILKLQQDLHLGERVSYKPLSEILKEIKLENIKNQPTKIQLPKGELYLNYEEFKDCISNVLIYDSLTNLKDDAPLKYLLDSFVVLVKDNLGHRLSAHLFSNPTNLIIPSDPIVIDYLEKQINFFYKDPERYKSEIENFQLPIMYEFYEEKDIKFIRPFRNDLLGKNSQIDKTWAFCYQIICDLFKNGLGILEPDYYPVHTKKIRVRLAKAWQQPFTDLTKVGKEVDGTNSGGQSNAFGNLMDTTINSKTENSVDFGSIHHGEIKPKEPRVLEPKPEDKPARKKSEAEVIHEKPQEEELDQQEPPQNLKELKIEFYPKSPQQDNSEIKKTDDGEYDDNGVDHLKEKVNETFQEYRFEVIKEEPNESRDDLSHGGGHLLKQGSIDVDQDPIYNKRKNSNFSVKTPTKDKYELQNRRANSIRNSRKQSMISEESPPKKNTDSQIHVALEKPKPTGTTIGDIVNKIKRDRIKLRNSKDERSKEHQNPSKNPQFISDPTCIRNFRWTKIMTQSLNTRLTLANLDWNEYYHGAEIAVSLCEMIYAITDTQYNIEDFTLSGGKKIVNSYMVNLKNGEIEAKKKADESSNRFKKRKEEVQSIFTDFNKKKLNELKVGRSLELKRIRQNSIFCREKSAHPKIDVTEDYIAQQKQKVIDFRNKSLEDKKLRDHENLAKARELVKKKKNDFRRFNKQKVSELDKLCVDTLVKRQKEEHDKEITTELNCFQSVKKFNQRQWDNKQKRITDKLIENQTENDKTFQDLMTILQASKYFTDVWEQIFLQVFDKYAHYNTYNIEKIPNPGEVYFKNLELDEIKKIRKSSPPKKYTNNPKYTQLLQNENIMRTSEAVDDKVSAGMGWFMKSINSRRDSIVSAKNQHHQDIMESDRPNYVVVKVNNIDKKLSLNVEKNTQQVPGSTSSERSKASDRDKDGDDKGHYLQKCNPEAIEMKFGHLNYKSKSTNEYAGFNEAIDHDVMIKLFRNSDLVPDLVKNEDLKILMNRISRFCNHYKSFNKQEFLDFFRWVTYEFSISERYIADIKDKLSDLKHNFNKMDLERLIDKIKTDSPKSKSPRYPLPTTDPPNKKKSITNDSTPDSNDELNVYSTPKSDMLDKITPKILNSKNLENIEENLSLDSDQKSNRTGMGSHRSKRSRRHRPTIKINDPSSLQIDEKTDALEGKKADIATIKANYQKEAQKLKKLQKEQKIKDVLESRFFGTKIEQRRYSQRVSWRKQVRPSIIENPIKFFKSLPKNDKEIFDGVNDSFEWDYIDRSLIATGEVKEKLENYLLVSKFLRIQLTKAFEKKFKKRFA